MIGRANSGSSSGSRRQSKTLVPWAVGIVWVGWGIVPAVASARPVMDLLEIYAWCAGAAVVAVTLLWLAAAGARAWGRALRRR